MMGTYIHWVLLFAWVLLFRKLIATGLIGTYIHRVLVIDGYLYSRVYGMSWPHIGEKRTVRDNDDPSMCITTYWWESVIALEDAQQFILSRGHVKKVMNSGLSVDSIVSLHLSTQKQTTFHQFYTP